MSRNRLHRSKGLIPMKLEIKGECGFHFKSENPDESLKQYWLDKLKEAYAEELQAFLEEVTVTMRKLKPGENATVESRPIKVTLEREALTPTPDAYLARE